MDEPVSADILQLFRANPLLRDTPEVIAMRAGRSLTSVQKALDELENEGMLAVRWVGGAPLYYFTGAPGHVADPGPTDPGPTDPGPADPGPTDPGPADPGSGDPAALEPVASSAVFTARLRAPCTLDQLHAARVAVEALCGAMGMVRSSVPEFAIAVSEALTNAYRYGRRGDGRDFVRVDFRADDEKIEVWIKDRGSGFPSLIVGGVHDDDLSTGGRGLMLMNSLTDEMEITRSGGGVTIRLVKRLQPAEDAGEP